MAKPVKEALAAMAASLMLCACGGSSSGGLASVPLAAPAPSPGPAPTPAPGPAPVPAPSPLPARLGLASDQSFATVYASPTQGTGEDFRNGTAPRSEQNLALELRYLPGSNTYEIKLPGLESGKLEPYFSNGDWTASNTVPVSGIPLPDGRVHMPVPGNRASPYSYTSFGYWNPQDETPRLPGQTSNSGVFAYGVPTPAGQVPLAGQASFQAPVTGYVRGGPADGFAVHGTSRLTFDFSEGRLTGYLNPIVGEAGWAGFSEDLGRYDFTQTNFAPGSTGFSGRFSVPGIVGASGSFSGIFTGPNAPELMARFETPFLANGVSGSLVGVWVGKRE